MAFVQLPVVPLALFALVGFWLARLLRQAYFSPLSRLAVPHWTCRFTEGWYAIHGQQSRIPYELLELHRRHGPLVRYGPRHVSIQSYEAHQQVYSPPQQTFRKDRGYYECFVIHHSLYNVFTTSDPVKHRAHRQILSPLFSRRSLLSTEPLLKEKAQLVGQLLMARGYKGASSNPLYAFRCMTLDVITQLAWGKSYDSLGSRAVGDFKISLLTSLDRQAPSLHLRQVVPRFFHFLGNHVPHRFFPPDVRAFFDLVDQAAATYLAYKSRGKSDSPYIVLFDLLTSGKKGLDVSDEMCIAEAVDVLVAGLDTTGHTIAVAAWALTVANPSAGAHLIAELDNAIEDWSSFPLTSLEELPYLNACVKEALRFGDAGNGLLPRVVPDGGAVIDGYALPAGTIVAASSIYIHHDESIFPDALAFKPERWLDAEGRLSNKLDPYMMQFSKGPRICIGKDLAFAELLITLSYVFKHCTIKAVAATPKQLEFVENFTGGVRGHELELLFKRRER